MPQPTRYGSSTPPPPPTPGKPYTSVEQLRQASYYAQNKLDSASVFATPLSLLRSVGYSSGLLSGVLLQVVTDHLSSFSEWETFFSMFNSWEASPESLVEFVLSTTESPTASDELHVCPPKLTGSKPPALTWLFTCVSESVRYYHSSTSFLPESVLVAFWNTGCAHASLPLLRHMARFPALPPVLRAELAKDTTPIALKEAYLSNSQLSRSEVEALYPDDDSVTVEKARRRALQLRGSLLDAEDDFATLLASNAQAHVVVNGRLAVGRLAAHEDDSRFSVDGHVYPRTSLTAVVPEDSTLIGSEVLLCPQRAVNGNKLTKLSVQLMEAAAATKDPEDAELFAKAALKLMTR